MSPQSRQVAEDCLDRDVIVVFNVVAGLSKRNDGRTDGRFKSSQQAIGHDVLLTRVVNDRECVLEQPVCPLTDRALSCATS